MKGDCDSYVKVDEEKRLADISYCCGGNRSIGRVF